jgi:hypothetical protein
MNRFLIYCIIFLLSGTGINLFAADTLYISKTLDAIDVYKNLSIFEDSTRTLKIKDILKKNREFAFYKNLEPKLNFEFSGSTFWLQLTIKKYFTQSDKLFAGNF